jgi:sugar transferase (PEP-CTERM/EpsH1 system associated)
MPVVPSSPEVGDRESATARPPVYGTGSRPLRVCHVIYRLGTGGLENGLVNLINRMDPEKFEHAVVCVDGAGAFAGRIVRPAVPVVELHKRPGFEAAFYHRAWRAFRRLRPDLVHTRNTAGLDAIAPARLAGVRTVMHGEHGRTADDPRGSNPRHNLLRRLNAPLVRRFTTVSSDLAGWLGSTVGIAPNKIEVLMNGVDVERFRPGPVDRRAALPAIPETAVVVGTVGRLDPVKGHRTLVDAVARLQAVVTRPVHLVIVGDGPERPALDGQIRAAGLGDVVHLVGERQDVPTLLRAFDIFCLPSLAEGISNTVLEAMATGLPVVATAVGGNGELVAEGATGSLVTAGDPDALAAGLKPLAEDAHLRRRWGAVARDRACASFSLEAMVRRYEACYTEAVGGKTRRR